MSNIYNRIKIIYYKFTVMGNKFDILSSIMSTLLTLIFRNNLPSFDETQNFNYAVPDPN